MVKEFLESWGISEEVRRVIYAVCLAVAVTYFVCDRFLFSDRSEILNQNRSEIENLKSENQKQERQLEEYSSALGQGNQKINELNKEVSRLQPYQQVLSDWKKALDDERVKSSNLQEQINQLSQSAGDLRQASDSCAVEVSNLRASNSKLSEIVSSSAPLLDKRSEIIGIERNKNSVEAKLMDLEGDSISREFNVEKIAHLKRLSAEYQQQILQLQQCEK